jgi:hypothetical protein
MRPSLCLHPLEKIRKVRRKRTETSVGFSLMHTRSGPRNGLILLFPCKTTAGAKQ